MKTYIPYSLILAAAASGLALGAETAYTTPVGYVTLGDTTVGQPSVKANTDSYISVPVYRPAVYAGVVASVAANVITLSGTPGFTDDQYVSVATPYMVLIEDGSASGLVGLISDNTANTVTLLLQPGEVTTGIAAGNKISIRLAWTLGSIFAQSAIPANTLVSVYGGNIGINTAADSIFEFSGTNWEDTDTFDNANNVVIFPGEGIKLRSPAATAITQILVSGEVGKANSRLLISKPSPTLGQDNLITYVSPVSQILGTTGLGISVGDQLIEWSNSTAGINKPATTILEYNGTIWENTDTFDDVTNTFTLMGGKAYRYRRSAAAAAGAVIVTSTPAYVPSL